MSAPDPFAGTDMLTLVIERDDVEACRTDEFMASLKKLLRQDMCERFRQRVNLSVSGYDTDARELYDIPELREFLLLVDSQWPYWSFFLWSGHGTMLPMLYLTLAGATSASRGTAKYDGQALGKVMMEKFGAMNQLCEWLGDSEETIEHMSSAVETAVFGPRG